MRAEVFAIYTRKSKFTGKGESIENQADLCRQYLRSVWNQEAADTALVYEDEGFSGGTLDRPAFRAMMAEAKEKKFRAVVVYRLDRISRNIGDFCALIARLSSMDVGFISIREQFDTTSPMGRAMMYISSVFSQLERETIAERIRDNMHELAKTGRWLGGTTPTGYRSEALTRAGADGRERRACRLVPVPEETSIIRLIFQKYRETCSLTKTEQYLLENNYLTRRGHCFTRFSVRSILANPVYAIADQEVYRYLCLHKAALFSASADFDGIHGVMAYNRTLQRPGKPHRINPMEQWIICVGEHPGLIDGGHWVEVQRLLEQNRASAFRSPRNHCALLSGLLRCGQCGSPMRPKLTSRQNEAFRYLCTLKERSKSIRCGMPNCSGKALDHAIMVYISSISEDTAHFNETLARLLQNKPPSAGAQTQSASIKCRIAEADKEIRVLVSALSEAADAGQYILQKIGQLHAQRQSLLCSLEEIQSSTVCHSPSAEEFEQTARLLSSFPALLQALSLEEKRYVVKKLVQGVVWDGTQAHVTPLCEDSK